MADRVCLVAGCDRASFLPGSGRGWCGLHYQRWKRHGDPLGLRPAVVGILPCKIADCEDLVRARHLCLKHYTRWKRYGDALVRLPGDVRDGCRVCPGCGCDKPLSDWTNGQCKACAAARAARYRATNPTQRVTGTPKTCDCCGQSFLANGRRSRYCSTPCFEAHRHKANWKHQIARRTRLRNAFVEAFDRKEIFDRDGWICQICDNPVDRSAPFPDPMSPSLDHIVPLARGGLHSRANAQTACLGCNVRKGVRLTA